MAVTVNVEMKFADIGTTELAYAVFGKGKDTIIVEAALGSCSAEWWHIADRLSAVYSVLVYDRAGYGKSSRSKLPRTPNNITQELYLLLEYLEVREKITFIGHSQGGLYAQQFAKSHPELTKGLILLDPLSANDSQFRMRLSENEYKQSGVDKTKSLKLGLRISKLKFGFLFKGLLKKSPPFYYYDYANQASEYILSTLTKAAHYQTALEEYQLAHSEAEILKLKLKEGFPAIPLILITHSSTIAIEEIQKFGGLSKEEAAKVELLWQELMQEYLSFTPYSKFIQATKSSHYIHLTEPELLTEALAEMV